MTKRQGSRGSIILNHEQRKAMARDNRQKVFLSRKACYKQSAHDDPALEREMHVPGDKCHGLEGHQLNCEQQLPLEWDYQYFFLFSSFVYF